MKEKKKKAGDFLGHARSYIIRGLLASIPLFLSLLVIQFLYVFIDKRVMNWLDQYTGFRIPGLGILLVLVFFYFIGLLASNVIGRRLFNIVEGILDKIPLLRTTYQIGKQVSSSFSLPEKQVFQKAVMVDYLNSGVWAFGFVTGRIVNKSHKNEVLVKVFLPTVPNPTTGFVIFVRESQIMDTKWTVEEAMRTIISGGIIGPESMN